MSVPVMSVTGYREIRLISVIGQNPDARTAGLFSPARELFPYEVFAFKSLRVPIE
jgi:hypothetical protein